MGNKNLQPETSTNFEIGLDYNSPGGQHAALTLYRTRYKDKIGRETICTSPVARPNCHYNGEVRARINQYVNIDSAHLTGLEASLAAPLGRTLRLTANYTLTDSEISRGPNRGKPLNNLPRHVLNLGADWKSAPALRLWAKARYRSKTLEPGKSQLPGYAMFDMGASYEVNPAVRLAADLYKIGRAHV